MIMYNPPHPGGIIRRQCLDPLGLTVAVAAEKLGVSPGTLSRLLDGWIPISPDMATRLSQVFGGSPESWLRQQNQYDQWHALHSAPTYKTRKTKAKVRPGKSKIRAHA